VRAHAAGLVEVQDVRACEVLPSVIPPHAAEDVARGLAGFTGIVEAAGAPGVVELFRGSVVDARVVSAASALKMVYAAWTKGSAALLLAIREAAATLGVEAELTEEWRLSQPQLEAMAERAAESATAKGWRWKAEMEEIADTLEAAGQPRGFHAAAAELYDAWG
jgi:alcohol dehydrogenase class IV